MPATFSLDSPTERHMLQSDASLKASRSSAASSTAVESHRPAMKAVAVDVQALDLGQPLGARSEDRLVVDVRDRRQGCL